MFQTEIHIALQSLSSDLLTWLMLQVTASGYYFFVVAMVIAVMFGVSLHRGFLLFQVIAWTTVFSEMAKKFFGLPRPFFVDSRVACLEPGWEAVASFRNMAGQGFFDLPKQAAIDAFRLQGLNFGLPSGHVSGAVAMWGGLAVLFRGRLLSRRAPFMVLLVALTRLYLGVHFLADILAGALLGGLVLFIAWKLSGDSTRRERFFAAARARIASSLPGALYLFFLFVLPLLLVLFALLSAKFAGFYIGLNAAFTRALRAGLPGDMGPVSVRLARVLLAGILFWLLSQALGLGLALLPVAAGSTWGTFLAAGLGTFLTVWAGLRFCLRLGLYHREPPPVS